MISATRSQVDILVGGFPCKNVSSLTLTPDSVKNPKCSSGAGWLGILAYCKVHKPDMILLENVGTLFSHRKVEGYKSAFLGCKDLQTACWDS